MQPFRKYFFMVFLLGFQSERALQKLQKHLHRVRLSGAFGRTKPPGSASVPAHTKAALKPPQSRRFATAGCYHR
jgi:hypothetical protein